MKNIPSLRPTAAELIEAAREHLTAKVIPAITDPRLRFQTLVAAHVLGVVERELAAGRAPLEHVRADAHALPGHPDDDAALCALIRGGAFDGVTESAALRAHLRMRTELALMAWSPPFLRRVRGA